MPRRRPAGSLLVSLAIHVVVGVMLVNIVFHYDFSMLSPVRTPAPELEHLTYISVTPGPPAGAIGGTGVSAPSRATTPARGLVAPSRVPATVIPTPAPSGGTPGGVVGGTGAGGGVGPVTGIVAADPDPRLRSDAHAFFPVPKTHAERVDSAVKATIYAFNDSVARARSGRKPDDWTFEKAGGKWGIDGSKIYLGKFAIPSAVLAALPLKIQGNPGESIADRLSVGRRAEVVQHAASMEHDEEFTTAVKRIRERKERERREKAEGTGNE